MTAAILAPTLLLAAIIAGVATAYVCARIVQSRLLRGILEGRRP